MSRLQFFGLAILVSCGGGLDQKVPPAASTASVQSADATVSAEEEVLLHEVQMEGVRAQFWGVTVPQDVSKRFGVRGLRFVFEDGNSINFTPRGQLFFTDWRFDILSPDGQHLLLLQDRYGPYHVVRTDGLAAYLGGGDPGWSFGYENPEGSAWVHEAAQWSSATEILYSAGLSDMFPFRFALE